MNEELVKTYIGKNYYNIKNEKFSAINFGIPYVYMFYRGMSLYSLIWIVVSAIIVFYLYFNIFLCIGALILLNAFVSFNFNSLYLDYVENKIKKLKKLNYTDEQILAIAKEKSSPIDLTSAALLKIIILGIVQYFFLIGGTYLIIFLFPLFAPLFLIFILLCIFILK